MQNRALRACFAVVLAALLPAAAASAKVTTESPYSRAQTFNCALRFIRVDQGLEIVEKDIDTGYFLFNYKSDAGATMGSVEVLEVDGKVRFVLQLPKYPEYYEQVLTKGIRSKLTEEYGEPPARVPAKPKEAPARPPAGTAPQKPATK